MSKEWLNGQLEVTKELRRPNGQKVTIEWWKVSEWIHSNRQVGQMDKLTERSLFEWSINVTDCQTQKANRFSYNKQCESQGDRGTCQALRHQSNYGTIYFILI